MKPKVQRRFILDFAIDFAIRFIVVSFALACATACKDALRSGASKVRDAQDGTGSGAASLEFQAAKTDTWPADGKAQPEDFSILFPIDFASLRGLASDDDLKTRLDSMLVPLSAVMATEVYEKLMRAAQGDYPGSRPEYEDRSANAIVFHVNEKGGESLTDIPFESWRIVGLRLSPCSDSLPLPPVVLRQLRRGKLLADFICRPQVRLVAQPFGARRVLVSESPPKTGLAGVSDDKALHLVFDYSEGPSVNAARAVLAADIALRKKIDALGTAGAGGTTTGTTTGATTVDEMATMVEDTHPSDVLTALEEQRSALLTRVMNLRGTASGALRVPYGGGADALTRYAAFLKNDLARTSVARFVTQNFATSGLKPDTAEHWVMASYSAEGPTLSLSTTVVSKQSVPLLARADTAGLSWLRFAFAPNIVFSPTLRGAGSLDPALVKMLSGDVVVRNALLERLPERTLVRAVPSGPGIETDPTERVGAGLDVLSGYVAMGLRHVNNPAVSNQATLPCTSCHLAPPVRERLSLVDVGENKIVGNRPALVLSRSHVDTSFGWNFRQLGYFETTPSIGERLARETDVDVRYARKAGF